MPTQTSKQKSAWENRFATPSVTLLVSELNHQMQCVAEHARQLVMKPGCVRETVAWQGVWKWTLTYSSTVEQSRQWMYIIPDPTKLRICVPISESVLGELPLKKTSRFIRDVIAHSNPVGLVRWPIWEVQTKSQAEDVLQLCALKLSVMVPKTSGS